MEARVSIEVTNKDMFALYNYVRMSETEPIGRRINQIIFLTFIILAAAISMNLGDIGSFIKTFLIAMFILIIIFGLKILPEILHKLSLPNIEKSFMKKSVQDLQIEGVRNYILNESGIEVKTVYGDLNINWEDVISFQETDDYLFFATADNRGAHVIPLKYFTSEQKKSDFINKFSDTFVKRQKK